MHIILVEVDLNKQKVKSQKTKINFHSDNFDSRMTANAENKRHHKKEGNSWYLMLPPLQQQAYLESP